MIQAFRINNLATKIMASSIRNPQHVIQSFKAGVDVITIPGNILEQMFDHPLTKTGYESFKRDLDQI